ncbi:cysteine desulfurase [Polaribacter sp. Z014]|uniref:cysteine desulfurase family protein n=1 Tax=unclassified Polaribacter TaxID=196858 RepID=UPI00193BF02F|nr:MULTISPECIES: cysteine desulfurase family protein [unclassified Polaribacter]MCL7763146.1 cysteine desulfurase [Polaribacter sp. Z014]QVY64995.1 cysteine desulfurase [Polaribacter sp. Q13]QVY65433.1 cysteine desulfurase [Polaribacter sp. Q13]
MNTVYLDSAATTQIDDEVIDVIYTSMKSNYGNPSSIHHFGRKAKTAVETARKKIAKHFNVTASEIIFTAGGTEADNLILHNAVFNLGVKRIITSKIEHHAVLHTCNHLEKTHHIIVDYVDVDEFGTVNTKHLEELLSASKEKTLVSLMLINNEIGNILDIDTIAVICKNNNALFHSDTVQAITHYPIDLQKIPVDFIVASAHKFHGPKGVGFAFFRKGFGILPMLHGGDQEMGARSSTENVHAILGMEKALEIAIKNLDKDKKDIENLKGYFMTELKSLSKNIQFNGLSSDLEKSSYTILNVRFPFTNEMLLFSLDMAEIAVSGGSACQSGSNKGSHVLREILNDADADKTSVRFSFSKYTTKQEIDFVVNYLRENI